MAAELVKLRTLRSSVWLLVVATAFTVVLGPVQSLGQVLSGANRDVDSSAVLSLALAGTSTATLLLGVLGVLFVAGEYAPRAIRTTFMLVPRRPHVVVAKAAALGLVTAVTGLVAVAIAVSVSLAIFTRADVAVGWGSPHVLRVSATTVWYLVGWAVLGQVAGWVTRSKLGGAALLIGVMLVLAPVLGLVPGRAGEILVGLMPSSAGAAMISTHHATALGAPAIGLLLWTGYLVGFSCLAAWFVASRDA
jgi:ABC-2 type transport system permease protein